MSQPRNAICWFEIYVDDMQRAQKFYGSVLEISFQDMPDPSGEDAFKMSFFPSDPDPSQMGVGGALIEMPGKRDGHSSSPTTIVYFPCNDCSVEEGRVAAAGGQVQRPKFSLGEFGFCSLCTDTEGNTFGLFSMQ